MYTLFLFYCTCVSKIFVYVYVLTNIAKTVVVTYAHVRTPVKDMNKTTHENADDSKFYR